MIHLGPLTAHGQYVKATCPFHENPSGKTLWIDRDSGAWGCWSTRCPRNKGGSLLYLFYLKGYSWEQAHQIVNSFEWSGSLVSQSDGFNTQADVDNVGLISKAHLALWRVDWHLAKEVLRAVAASPLVQQYASIPLSQWLPVPAGPGQLEHDHWQSLWYMLGKRGITPESLQKMDIGFDKRLGLLTFPLYDQTGKLIGIGRRSPVDGAKYYLSGTFKHITDEGYIAVPVNRGECLWGWWEQWDLITHGNPIVVVEGYVDQLRLVDYGFTSVAKLGKKLTQQQLALLMSVPNPIVHWPDNDTDGLISGREDVIATMFRPSTVVVSHPTKIKDAGACPRLFAQRAVSEAISPPEFLGRLPAMLVTVDYKK